MEVMVMPFHADDFDFNSARSTPFSSPPGTPRRFGASYYCSAPTSPSRLSEFYREFDELLYTAASSNEKSSGNGFLTGELKNEDEFAFDIVGEAKAASVTAEELFDGGMIKPLKPKITSNVVTKPPPRSSSPVSQGRKMIMNAFSQKQKKGSDPSRSPAQRGRERASDLSSSSRRRPTRSLSPLRVSQYPWEEEEEEAEEQQELLQKRKQASTEANSSSSLTNSSSSALTTSSSKGQRKWRFKDFFLFRSASEGRASDKDPLRKYTALFRRVDSPSGGPGGGGGGGGGSSMARRKGQVSAHELHYTANRAAKQEMKKKTFLPYKQGILGRLAINPGVHAWSNGFPFYK